jgi:hypothetical protein
VSTNVAVSISADVTQLTAKLAVAKADLSATTAELRNMAAQMRTAGASASEELKAGLSQTAAAAASAQSSVARLRSELQAAKAPMEGVSAAGEHQAGIFREKLVMAHEALFGSYKRMAGSMMVLTERTGSLAGAFGTLLSPTTLIVAGVAAVAGAFIEMLSAAERWSEAFGQIKAAMDATGQGFDYSRDRIGSYIDQLRQLHGVTTTTATEMVAAFAQQRDIGVESYVGLGQAAAGYARVTGTDVKKASEELITVLNGGYNSVAKLDQRFSFLSVTQAKTIHDFEENGQKAQALAVAIEALQAKFGKLINDGLTPMQKASNDVKSAWDDLTRSISESAWANRFNANLASVMKSMAGWIDSMGKAKQAVVDLNAAVPTAPAVAGPAMASHAPVSAGPAVSNADAEHLRVLREIQDENFRLKADDGERERIKQELARDEEALKTATGGEAALIRDNIALLQRQQRELNNRVGAGQLQSLRDELEQELVQRRLVGEHQKQYELKFWQDHLAQVQAGSRAELDIRKQIATLQHDTDTKSLSDEWANFSETMRLKIEASKSNVGQQIALAEQWVEKGKSLYGDDIKAYKAALDEKARLLQQQMQDDQNIRQIAMASRAEIAKIDLAGAPAPKGKGANSLVNWLFGDLDGEGAKAELDRRTDALKLEFQAKQAEFQAIAADPNSSSVQIAEAQAKLVAVQEQYSVDTVNLNKQAAQQVTQAWQNAFAPIEHAFTSSIEGMLMGTQTLQQGIKRLGLSMVESLMQSGIKQAFSFISTQLSGLATTTMASQSAQTAAVAAGTAARSSVSRAGAAVDAATQKQGALGHAASSAAAVYDDVAQIPFVGWLLAPPAAAAAFAAVAAFGGMIPSAAGGWASVPADGTLAELHRNEMVLPERIASPLRTFAESGASAFVLPAGIANAMRQMNAPSSPSGPSGRGGTGDVNFHYAPSINAGSNVDLEALLLRQGTTMRRWLSNQMRNGAFRT